MEFDDKNQLELPFYKVNILCAKICCLTKNLAINKVIRDARSFAVRNLINLSIHPYRQVHLFIPMSIFNAFLLLGHLHLLKKGYLGSDYSSNYFQFTNKTTLLIYHQ